MTPEELLENSLASLRRDFGLYPIFGAEIECYIEIDEGSQEALNHFFTPIYDQAISDKIPLLRIEKERGEHQYEFVLGLSKDAQLFAAQLHTLRNIVLKHARDCQIEASFAAKPYDDSASSGMHVHLHLCNVHNENVMHKTDDYISPELAGSIAGLCAISPYVMPVLYPDASSYDRLCEKDHVARYANWGSNNRTCAVRIPYTQAWEDKRIEWRLPCADANASQVIAIMMHAVVCGIKQKMVPHTQTYGVSDKEEKGVLLPNSLSLALDTMDGMPAIFMPLTAEILREWL